VPERFTQGKVERCLDTKKWQWDGVEFAFLSPFPHAGLVGNNASCVLRVSNGKQSILLTGDIEKQGESILLQRHKKMLLASIIIVPHHGSKTSSTTNFLNAVAPKYAIFSTGYLNSYRHPHRVVVERYTQIKSKIFNTTSSGAITMTLLPHSNEVIIDEYRKSHKHIWHDFFNCQ
jgi:competence protein ComEC